MEKNKENIDDFKVTVNSSRLDEIPKGEYTFSKLFQKLGVIKDDLKAKDNLLYHNINMDLHLNNEEQLNLSYAVSANDNNNIISELNRLAEYHLSKGNVQTSEMYSKYHRKFEKSLKNNILQTQANNIKNYPYVRLVFDSSDKMALKDYSIKNFEEVNKLLAKVNQNDNKESHIKVILHTNPLEKVNHDYKMKQSENFSFVSTLSDNELLTKNQINIFNESLITENDYNKNDISLVTLKLEEKMQDLSTDLSSDNVLEKLEELQKYTVGSINDINDDQLETLKINTSILKSIDKDGNLVKALMAYKNEMPINDDTLKSLNTFHKYTNKDMNILNKELDDVMEKVQKQSINIEAVIDVK